MTINVLLIILALLVGVIMMLFIAALLALFCVDARHMVSAVLPFVILFCLYVIAECEKLVNGVVV